MIWPCLPDGILKHVSTVALAQILSKILSFVELYLFIYLKSIIYGEIPDYLLEEGIIENERTKRGQWK